MIKTTNIRLIAFTPVLPWPPNLPTYLLMPIESLPYSISIATWTILLCLFLGIDGSSAQNWRGKEKDVFRFGGWVRWLLCQSCSESCAVGPVLVTYVHLCSDRFTIFFAYVYTSDLQSGG